MFGMSFMELAIVAVLALVLLGPDELPGAARKIGKALRALRQATDGLRTEVSQLQAGAGDDGGLGALRDLHKLATDTAALVKGEVLALAEFDPAPSMERAEGIVPVATGEPPPVIQAADPALEAALASAQPAASGPATGPAVPGEQRP
jgi:sec-independent protein translocase protein TatB